MRNILKSKVTNIIMLNKMHLLLLLLKAVRVCINNVCCYTRAQYKDNVLLGDFIKNEDRLKKITQELCIQEDAVWCLAGEIEKL